MSDLGGVWDCFDVFKLDKNIVGQTDVYEYVASFMAVTTLHLNLGQ